MNTAAFRTDTGDPVTAVTATEMREVDRVAVDEIGLTLVRMMEHAGRALANQALRCRQRTSTDPIVILAGSGGNGGGGFVCARHLHNRDIPVVVSSDRDPENVTGVPGEQLDILRSIDVPVVDGSGDDLPTASLVVDALVGYGLDGEPRGSVAKLIEWADSESAPTLSLDVPSGTNATTGEAPGVAVIPERTVTLALPKTGLTSTAGDVVLADISVPAVVYDRLDIPYDTPFGEAFSVLLTPTAD